MSGERVHFGAESLRITDRRGEWRAHGLGEAKPAAKSTKPTTTTKPPAVEALAGEQGDPFARELRKFDAAKARGDLPAAQRALDAMRSLVGPATATRPPESAALVSAEEQAYERAVARGLVSRDLVARMESAMRPSGGAW